MGHRIRYFLLTGIPCSCGLSSRLCSSFLEASIFSRSAASTMYLLKGTGFSSSVGLYVYNLNELNPWLHHGNCGKMSKHSFQILQVLTRLGRQNYGRRREKNTSHANVTRCDWELYSTMQRDLSEPYGRQERSYEWVVSGPQLGSASSLPLQGPNPWKIVNGVYF